VDVEFDRQHTVCLLPIDEKRPDTGARTDRRSPLGCGGSRVSGSSLVGSSSESEQMDALFSYESMLYPPAGTGFVGRNSITPADCLPENRR
jgi:hypothetical protein